MTNTTKIRYVLVETNSGYIWGDAIASSPIEAARIVDEGVGEYGRSYEEMGHDPHDTHGGYRVYVAPADLIEDYDGQDEALIERINELDMVAYVQTTDSGL